MTAARISSRSASGGTTLPWLLFILLPSMPSDELRLTVLWAPGCETVRSHRRPMMHSSLYQRDRNLQFHDDDLAN